MSRIRDWMQESLFEPGQEGTGWVLFVKPTLLAATVFKALA
jgi:hypothetical protein